MPPSWQDTQYLQNFLAHKHPPQHTPLNPYHSFHFSSLTRQRKSAVEEDTRCAVLNPLLLLLGCNWILPGKVTWVWAKPQAGRGSRTDWALGFVSCSIKDECELGLQAVPQVPLWGPSA